MFQSRCLVRGGPRSEARQLIRTTRSRLSKLPARGVFVAQVKATTPGLKVQGSLDCLVRLAPFPEGSQGSHLGGRWCRVPG
jgi:hypothetical protein